MKSAPGALINLLNSAQEFLMADLYLFTLLNGTTLAYTGFDSSVVDGATTYLTSALIIERTAVKTVMGLQVDTLNLVIYPRTTDAVGGLTFLQACASGLMDGATLVMRRGFFSSTGTYAGSFLNFTGLVGDIQMSRDQISLTVNSPLYLLNVQLPKNLYQATCIHILYDGGCTMNAASFAVGGTVTSSTSTSISSGVGSPTSWFDQGYIVFTSGVLTGTKRTVKYYNNPGYFALLNPLLILPSPGDNFTAYPGCDKALATCKNKYNNIIHFKAMPFVPVPETAA